jgi:hypothetical protein
MELLGALALGAIIGGVCGYLGVSVWEHLSNAAKLVWSGILLLGLGGISQIANTWIRQQTSFPQPATPAESTPSPVGLEHYILFVLAFAGAFWAGEAARNAGNSALTTRSEDTEKPEDQVL